MIWKRMLHYRWLALVLALFMLTASLAMVSDTSATYRQSPFAENYLYAQTFKVDLIDLFANGQFFLPGDTINKDVSMKNNGDVNAIVRIYLIPSWTPETAAGLTLDPAAVTIGFASTVGMDWTYIDGWWYYNRILKPGEETTRLVDSLKLAVVANEHHETDYSAAAYTLDVVGESLQAVPVAAQENWDMSYSSNLDGTISWSTGKGA